MNNGSVGIERLSISVYSLFNRQMKRALITSKQTAIFFPGSLRRLRLWVRGRKGARFARTPTWKHTQLWMSRLFCDPDMQRSPVRCLLVIYFFTYFQAWNAFCMRIALGDHIRRGLAWSGHIEFLNRDPFVVRKIYPPPPPSSEDHVLIFRLYCCLPGCRSEHPYIPDPP